MSGDAEHHERPGWVTVSPTGPRHPVVLAGDAALGAAAVTARAGVRVATAGIAAGAEVVRVAGLVPGTRSAASAASRALRPLAEDGLRVRSRTGDALATQVRRLIEDLAPSVVEALDVNSLVERIDIDGVVSRIDIERVVSRIAIDRLVGEIDIDTLVSRIDIDQLVRRIAIDDLVSRIEIDDLVSRIEIDALVRRIEIDDLVSRIDIDKLVSRIAIDRLVGDIDIDALVGRIQIDEVVGRIDLDRVVGDIDIAAIVDRVDVNEVVQRVDVDAIVEQTELGTIVARSTSGIATETLDAARTQGVTVDDAVGRIINRVLRRRAEDLPAGPPQLVQPVDRAVDEEPPA
jgi:hypothetical protein